VRRKIPAEDFHITKNFVLVCRTDPAFKIWFHLAKKRVGSPSAFRSQQGIWIRNPAFLEQAPSSQPPG
jgi:hypothetical protein